jgi:hypothetical protein
MSRVNNFLPEMRRGVIFHSAAIVVLVAASAWGVWQASRATTGVVFVAALLPALISAALVPMLLYRVYALRRASYVLEREGVRLRWGLRFEDIPMNAVLWMHKGEEHTPALPLPWPYWPGAVLGVRHSTGAGAVEYLASDASRLVLIGTTKGIFAISPSDRDEFLLSYRRLAELGSLFPLQARSVFPSFLLARVWRTIPARVLLLVGFLCNLLMLGWVGVIAPGRTQVVLGFIAGAEAVPAVRLLLLPIVSSFFFLVDFFLGLFFFRREEPSPGTPGQVYAYLLWGSGALTSTLMLIAIFFILQNS